MEFTYFVATVCVLVSLFGRDIIDFARGLRKALRDE
jgi:hypothetical protein